MSKKCILLSVFLILSLALATGCMRQAALQNLSNLPVMGATGQDLNKAKVKQAIIEGAKSKGWIARELTPGVISASLAVRAHQAEVEIPYTGSSYSIVYKNSVNLDYSSKDQTIHNQYNNWVLYLREAIDVQLAGQQ